MISIGACIGISPTDCGFRLGAHPVYLPWQLPSPWHWHGRPTCPLLSMFELWLLQKVVSYPLATFFCPQWDPRQSLGGLEQKFVLVEVNWKQNEYTQALQKCVI